MLISTALPHRLEHQKVAFELVGEDPRGIFRCGALYAVLNLNGNRLETNLLPWTKVHLLLDEEHVAIAYRTTMEEARYKALKPPGTDIPPQARTIVSVLGNGSDGMTEAELINGLAHSLKTCQPPARILAYYKPLLVSKGYLSFS